jgi:hypothetical protein
MNYQLQGWQPDPFGSHEFRFFSDDGKPTLLVRDGDARAYDPPPASVDRPVVPTTAPVEDLARDGAVTEAPACHIGVDHNVDLNERRKTVADRLLETNARRTSLSALDLPVHHAPRLTITAKIAYGVVLIAMLGSAVALGVLHLHGRTKVSPQSSPTTSASNSTSPSTSASSSTDPTTATALPSAPQPSAAVAAADLISSWAAGNQARALSVATPSAVSTLFAGHYSSALVIDRGCSVAFSPIVCSYGPPGGAAPTDPIYEIYVTQATGGWYVSSARINN